jgi:hypothetical protein
MQMTARECQSLAEHLAEAPSLEERMHRLQSWTRGMSSAAPGECAACYDHIEKLLERDEKSLREAAAVFCLGLTCGLPVSPLERPTDKLIKEQALGIVNLLRGSRDPTYGGNVLPVIHNYMQGANATRWLLLHGLLSLLESKNGKKRSLAQTVCLGFLLFAHGSRPKHPGRPRCGAPPR